MGKKTRKRTTKNTKHTKGEAKIRFTIDQKAEPGNVVRPLASLLIDLDRKTKRIS